MKRQFNLFLWLLTITTLVVSCNKASVSQGFQPFCKLIVNGNKKSIDACGTSAHVAQYLKDTAILVGFGCGGVRVGFYIQGNIADGTYHLDHNHQAWYDEEPIRYSTDSLHQGTVTIRTKRYQVSGGGSIPYIEGEITFYAIDQNTKKIIRVTDGKYLLKKYQS